MTTYIHYGHDHFDSNLFIPISQSKYFNKPDGGLWASPVGAKFGWKDWCNAENFRECREDNSFRFKLSDEANVFHIREAKDLYDVPKLDSPVASLQKIIPDFLKMQADGVDAVELHLSEEPPHELLDGLYWLLYGWDCDSIVILNPDIIVPLER